MKDGGSCPVFSNWGYTFHYPCINLLGSLSQILYRVHNSNHGRSFYFSVMVPLLVSVVAGYVQDEQYLLTLWLFLLPNLMTR